MQNGLIFWITDYSFLCALQLPGFRSRAQSAITLNINGKKSSKAAIYGLLKHLFSINSIKVKNYNSRSVCYSGQEGCFCSSNLLISLFMCVHIWSRRESTFLWAWIVCLSNSMWVCTTQFQPWSSIRWQVLEIGDKSPDQRQKSHNVIHDSSNVCLKLN